MSDASDRPESYGLEVAVVGMAGRFPGASTVEEFWRNVTAGVESISFFSDEEVEGAGADPSHAASSSYVKAAGVLEGVDRFDAAFFGYSPREAALIDPQQRVFLETVWAALEDAGVAPSKYEGSIGIYAGCGQNHYRRAGSDDYQSSLASEKDFLTTRASYKLGLRGPSVAVQTACSTSLVAIHLACQALVSGECDTALAGGVCIRLPQKKGYLYQEEGILSPDGHCRAFDEKARGSVPGNGCAVVVLKRLREAIESGDCIHAIVRGTAINNDGAHKVGYTAPSVAGQADVIRSALLVAEVEADTIGYVEAHGTGTPLGDPIEVEALSQAFGERTSAKGFCGIGSVKTNVGHLDAAAGVAGFIKAALSVRDGLLPPSLHFERPNPKIRFAGSPFYVNTKLHEWPRKPGSRRRAGVSSFGIGGTNAHAIVEEPPDPPESDDGKERSRTDELLLLSARTEGALEAARSRLARYLDGRREIDLSSAAETLREGRTDFPYRVSCTVVDVEDAIEKLSRPKAPVEAARDPQVAFLFPGQGSQYVDMARGLYEAGGAFRDEIDRIAEILRPSLGADLRETLYPDDSFREEAARRLRDTRFAQPAIFAVSYALARTWMSLGVRPAAMIGHSIGEYVAACLAGVLTLPEGLALVAARGRLMGELPAGSMLAAALGPEALSPLLSSELAVAAINAPDLTIVSGPDDAVHRLESRLRELGVQARPLHTSHAFHSPMVEPILETFESEIGKVHLRAPQIPFVSNLTGTWIAPDEARDPSYWSRHLRETVRFSAGLAALAERARIAVEVGPGRTLTSLVRRGGAGLVAVASTRHPQDGEADTAAFLDAAGELWAHGVEVRWRSLGTKRRRRVPLPTYPFEGDRHWLEPSPAPPRPPAPERLDISRWFSVPSWRRLPPPIDTGDVPRSGSWLVLSDGHGVGAEIARRLSAQGATVTTAIAEGGRDFARIGKRLYRIDPRRSEDYGSLVAALVASGERPDRVVHCFAVEPEATADRAPETLERELERGFASLLFLVQSFGAHDPEAPTRFTLVTTNVHEVSGEEALHPGKAAVVGPLRTIPLEYRGFQADQIDIVLPAEGSLERHRCLDLVMAALGTASPRPVVALRGSHFWEPTLAPVRLEAQSASPFREGGTYLITGGLGGIGLALAEHLARTVRAKLVLVGRRPFPARSEWDRRLAREEAPEPTPDLSGVEARARSEAGLAPLSSFDGLEADLDALCSAYVRAYLEARGVAFDAATRWRPSELKRHLGVADKLDRYFEMMLRILREDGLLEEEGGELRFAAPGAGERDASTLELRVLQRHPRFRRIFELLGHCSRKLDSALRSDVPSVEVLFGDEGRPLFQAAIENVLEHSAIPVYQEVIRELVSDLRRSSRPRTLRILEVGGGEGVLTRSLLPVLSEGGVEYTFTDIGRSFVLEAERRARDEGHDFMRFATLDISRPAAAQGFSAQDFDVVVAFNVVHAARDVGRALGHLKDLLRPGGFLVLQESVRPSRWVDFVWGLTDGWWSFEDRSLRKSSPLLPLDRWERVLAERGFERTESFPRAPDLRERTDSGLAIARKPAGAESGGEPTVSMKIRKLRELEAAGAEILVKSADVADREAMKEVIDEARARFGAIHGVVHAALVLRDGAMQSKTREGTREVLAPKVHGTLVLRELLSGLDLDFFVCFSSLVSILGGSGQVDYCAASNVQDCFALVESRDRARSVVSIDWAAWREVGMARRAALARGASAGDVLPHGMTTAEGIEALTRILQSKMPRVLVSPEPLLAPPPAVRDREDTVTAANDRGEEDPPPASSKAERILVGIWRELLGVPRIGVHDNFFELGADSIITLQFIAGAKKAGLHFTNSQVFERQTIAELAALVGEAGEDSPA